MMADAIVVAASRLRYHHEAPDGRFKFDRPLAVLEAVDRWSLSTVTVSPNRDDAATLTAQIEARETEVVASLDELAKRYVEAVGSEANITTLLQHLFGLEGFVGNTKNYYHPDNSRLTRVLGNRTGLPLSLAVVASEVGRRCEIDLRPVGLPGHVLLGEGSEPTRWWDTYAGGAPLNEAGCQDLYRRLGGNQPFDERMLRPLDSGHVLIRSINNIFVAHAKQGRPSASVGVLQLRVAMPSPQRSDWQRLLKVLLDAGLFEDAAAVLDQLATTDPQQSTRYRKTARHLRARWN